MNAMQQGIVLLLKSAITEEACTLPEGFDLEKAYQTVRFHQIAPMIYDGARRCGIPQSLSVMQKLFQSYCKALLVGEGQLRELERLYKAFNENGFDYLPLKGSVMKAYYPKQELRLMGDADILIRKEQYNKITIIMKELGFKEHGESDHDFTWSSDTLHLELHKNLMPTETADYHAYFGDGWSRAVQLNGTHYIMKKEDEFIFLFAHFAKHFRFSGIGCRHVVDLWVYLRTHPELDQAYIENELNKLHLLAFYQNIRRMIACWFEDRIDDDKTRLLTEMIFSSGSWGTMESATVATAVRSTANDHSVFHGKVDYVLRCVFPGFQTLSLKYPILKKAPVLLPCVWVYHLVNKLLFSHWSIRTHLKNVTALSQDQMDTHRKRLEYIGFDDFF